MAIMATNSDAGNLPGVREAHLLRRRDNPLFEARSREVSADELADARLLDGSDLDRFMTRFQELVQQAAELPPDAAGETVLQLKEALDESYQQACALPGDQTHILESIATLTAAIMRAVRAGAGADAYAQRQLDEEDAARRSHYALQQLPLVAALTHPDGPIGEQELVPSLLSEDDERLRQTLAIFDPQQLSEICTEASHLLNGIDPQRTLDDAWRRLALIEQEYRRRADAPPH